MAVLPALQLDRRLGRFVLELDPAGDGRWWRRQVFVGDSGSSDPSKTSVVGSSDPPRERLWQDPVTPRENLCGRVWCL